MYDVLCKPFFFLQISYVFSHYQVEISRCLSFIFFAISCLRDLKFDNVLINREGHIKIADFGLSHYGTPFEEICDNEICGTDLYIAPEVRFLSPISWRFPGHLFGSCSAGKSPGCEAVLGQVYWLANL